MMKLSPFKILILIFFFLVSYNAYSDSTIYVPKNNELLKIMYPSSDRYVASLAGTWEKSYNGSDWSETYLPSCENTAGKVIYRKELKIDGNNLDRFTWQLQFLGIQDEVEIYLNENFIGRYLGGMVPFSVKLPSNLLNKTGNILKLAVYEAGHSSKLVMEQGLFNKKVYTGVLRDIILLGTKQIWLGDIRYVTNFHNNYQQCTLDGNVKLCSGEIEKLFAQSEWKDSLHESISGKTSVNLELMLKNKNTGEIVSRGNVDGLEVERERTIPVNFSLGVNNPNPWSPASPFLYDLILVVKKRDKVIDEITLSLGLVEYKAWTIGNTNLILLNGQPIEIKGVAYIEDHYNGNQTLSQAQMEQDIMLIKTLGANTVKFKFTPPNPYLAYLCDKNGLMMMIELPAYNIPTAILGSDEIRVRMSNIGDKILSAYGSNTSVLGWGITNGVQEGTRETLDFTRSLTKLFHEGSNKLVYKTVLLGAKDLDINGFDFIVLKDNRRYKHFYELQNETQRMVYLAQKKPVLFSYGMTIQPSNFNGFADPLSIEAQSFYIENIDSLSNALKLAGTVLWSFNDYELQNPLMIADNPDQYACNTGLVDRGRQLRKSFQTLKALFNNEKVPLLDAGSFMEQSPISFIIVGIILALIILFLINRFRRFREYLSRAMFRPYNFYSDIRDQRIMPTVQSILLAAVISVSLGIYFSSIFYFFRTSEIAQYILSMFVQCRWMREIIYKLVWMPEVSMFFLSVIFMVWIFFVALIIKLFSIFVQSRIYFTDTFTMSIWSAVPMLILLPPAIILIRVMILSPSFFWIAAILFIFVSIWIFARVLRATAVVFDIPSSRTYLSGFLLVTIIFLLFATIYQYKFSVLAYCQYLLNVVIN
jgi:hypothetical protein